MPEQQNTAERFHASMQKLGEHRTRVTTPALAEALVREFGGVEALARTIHTEFFKETNGPMVRRGILNDITRLIIHVTDLNKDRVVDEMNDDEIKEQLRHQLKLMQAEEEQAEALHGTQETHTQSKAG